MGTGLEVPLNQIADLLTNQIVDLEATPVRTGTLNSIEVVGLRGFG